MYLGHIRFHEKLSMSYSKLKILKLITINIKIIAQFWHIKPVIEDISSKNLVLQKNK